MDNVVLETTVRVDKYKEIFGNALSQAVEIRQTFVYLAHFAYFCAVIYKYKV